MQVGPDPFGVGREEVGFGGLHACVLDYGLHRRVDRVQLIYRINVGHVPGVQDVVQILQERLALDLSGSEQDIPLYITENSV